MAELNIKSVAFTSNPEDYVTFEVKPNFKLLGPKFGKKVKAIQKTLAQGDAAAYAAQLAEGPLRVVVDGETVELTGDEVEVRLQAKEGFTAAQGRHMVVVLGTEISDELRREGWVREFIRCVQDMRKEQGLAYDARIAVAVATGDDALASTLADYESLIAGEVLADRLTVNGGNGGGEAKTWKIDDSELEVQVAAVG
jgi:isoleucyl-tRNA synthetase